MNESKYHFISVYLGVVYDQDVSCISFSAFLKLNAVVDFIKTIYGSLGVVCPYGLSVFCFSLSLILLK